MKKEIYFDKFARKTWPDPKHLERYFLGPPDQRWSYYGGNDNWGMSAEGVDGSEDLDFGKGRIDIRLDMYGHPKFGVLLIWSKWGGGFKETYSSRGDLTRLHEWVRTLQEDLRPIGLFIPFEQAWKAVKEFIENDGALPKSIEWIANRDLPPGAFPEPHAKVRPIHEKNFLEYPAQWRDQL
jgi:hypothetical protein